MLVNTHSDSTVLAAVDVAVSYGDYEALTASSFSVDTGELIAVVGPNGAGKSTLFSMLTGVLQATKGSAKIFGFDIKTQIDEIRTIMGVVPQFDILWSELTAIEHMRIFS